MPTIRITASPDLAVVQRHFLQLAAQTPGTISRALRAIVPQAEQVIQRDLALTAPVKSGDLRAQMTAYGRVEGNEVVVSATSLAQSKPWEYTSDSGKTYGGGGSGYYYIGAVLAGRSQEIRAQAGHALFLGPAIGFRKSAGPYPGDDFVTEAEHYLEADIPPLVQQLAASMSPSGGLRPNALPLPSGAAGAGAQIRGAERGMGGSFTALARSIWG